MTDWLNRSYWQYYGSNPDLFSWAYHWLNLVEGMAWCVFGILVTARYTRHRRTPLEIAYATTFVIFGMTDFREAFDLQLWLIVAKGVNLTVLLWLRHRVLTKYYPTSRVF